jgi:hypothetical protein
MSIPRELGPRLTYPEFLLHQGRPGFEVTSTVGVRKYDDLAGLIFGKLLAVKVVTASANFFLGARWLCRCACTGKREVWSKHLLSGRIQDCGCRERDRTRKRQQRARLAAPKVTTTVKKLLGTNPRIPSSRSLHKTNK